jgi:hypothetical protein
MKSEPLGPSRPSNVVPMAQALSVAGQKEPARASRPYRGPAGHVTLDLLPTARFERESIWRNRR